MQWGSFSSFWQHIIIIILIGTVYHCCHIRLPIAYLVMYGPVNWGSDYIQKTGAKATVFYARSCASASKQTIITEFEYIRDWNMFIYSCLVFIWIVYDSLWDAVLPFEQQSQVEQFYFQNLYNVDLFFRWICLVYLRILFSFAPWIWDCCVATPVPMK